MVLARKQTTWLFVALAATVYGAVFFVTRAHTAALHAGAIGLGAACDLTITVPVLYYLLLVRPGHSSWMALVAVTLAGARAAGFLLSAAEQTYLPPLRWLGVPLEIWVVVTVARRLRRPAAGGDTVTRIREAAVAVFRYGWAAELVATEVAVFYYALFAWRARPQSAPGYRSFGLAEASGYGMFSILLMMAVAVEGVPLHLLLRSWSHAGAWIFTGAGIYGFVWMVALYRSLALRPVLVGRETVLLQVGFLWRAEFRRDQIRGVRRYSAADTGYLSLVVINEPQWLIELHEPVVVCGPFGRRKAVTRIGVAVDDGDAFCVALSHSLAF
jgi:hypothetical protein